MNGRMKRSPLLYWVLTCLTFAQFAFVWVFLMARDVNALTTGRRLRLRIHVAVFSAAYTIYWLGLLYVGFWSQQTSDEFQRVEAINVWIIPLAIGMMFYFGWLLVFLAKRMREMNSSAEPKTKTVLLLSLFWALSLPYLQKHLNKAVEVRT
jgi:hypothetical protein